jgi:hypothetical protein
MWFLTTTESENWVLAHGVPLNDRRLPASRSDHHAYVRTSFPPSVYQLLWFCRLISTWLQPRSRCLLWVTKHGLFSSENLHLYYRLRQGYGDHRLLDEAPGHLFLDFEEPDLVSLLEVCLLSGWDLWLVPELEYGGADTARVFVNDATVAFLHRDEAEVGRLREQLNKTTCRILE